MGYEFIGAGTSMALNIWQMAQVRLVLLEAGIIDGDGLERIFGNEAFAPAAETMPAAWFAANDGRPVSAAQCVFTAARLRAALAADLIGDMRLFYEDQPTQLGEWVEEFAAFNELAAAGGGYRIA